MDETPDDAAESPHPENPGRHRLNPKTPAASFGRLRIPGHIQDAAADPDKTNRGRDGIADIDREQPERWEENRHPFQGIHLDPKHPFEIGISGYSWHLDAECSARLGHPNGGVEVKRDGEAGDQCSKVKHGKNPLEATASPSIAGHLQISYPAVATPKADRPFPIGKARAHPALRIQRDAFDR